MDNWLLLKLQLYSHIQRQLNTYYHSVTKFEKNPLKRVFGEIREHFIDKKRRTKDYGIYRITTNTLKNCLWNEQTENENKLNWINAKDREKNSGE